MKLSKSIIILLVALILLSVVVGVGLVFFYPKTPAKTTEAPATAPAATPGTPVPNEFDPVEWTRDPKSPALQAPANTAPASGDGFTVTLPPAEKPSATSALPASPGATFPGDAPAANEPVTKPVTPEAPAATPKAAPASKTTPAPKAAPVKAAPPAAKVAPKTAKVAEYWIQVASFKDRFQAENTAKALETQGLKGTLTTATVNGQAVVRVRVGPYANAAEAAKFLAWLTPVKEFAASYVTKVSATRATP